MMSYGCSVLERRVLGRGAGSLFNDLAGIGVTLDRLVSRYPSLADSGVDGWTCIRCFHVISTLSPVRPREPRLGRLLWDARPLRRPMPALHIRQPEGCET